MVGEPAQLLVPHLWNSPGSSGLVWRRCPQALAHALGGTSSEDRRVNKRMGKPILSLMQELWREPAAGRLLQGSLIP